MHIHVKLKVLLNIFMLAFSSPFVSVINFATDLTEILYTGNEIPWKQLEVPLVGCWSKSNSPVLDLLSLSLCIGSVYEHFLRHWCNSYPAVSLALELLHRKQVTARKGEDDEWVGGCRGRIISLVPRYLKKCVSWDGRIHPFPLKKTQTNSVAWVRKRTIPTGRTLSNCKRKN
jgi:hypothetical protein